MRKIAALLNGAHEPSLQWIEVASTFHIPSFHIVGLPSPEVSEAKERVRAAIEATGLNFPKRRIVLNLSPASIRKQGTGLDLAMALAILASSEEKDDGDSQHTPLTFAAWGELGLDGSVKPAYQLTRMIHAAWLGGVDLLFISKEEQELASQRLGLLAKYHAQNRIAFKAPPVLIGIGSLAEAWKRFQDILGKGLRCDERKQVQPVAAPRSSQVDINSLMPLSPSLARAIGVAAMGKHHILLLGPKGTGKSHALEWLIALLPPPSLEHQVHHTLLSELHESSHSSLPLTPIRRVGSHTRPAALVGRVGGLSQLAIRPGEFSLAHGGLLLADELPEWPRDSRELLREPLESGQVILTRSRGTVELPAQFILGATGNLCPCGGWPARLPLPARVKGMPRPTRCRCTSLDQARYLARLSGPVLDRLDMVLLTTLNQVSPDASKQKASGRIQYFQELQEKVQKAHERALSRWGCSPGHLTSKQLEELGMELPFETASLRSRHKVLRVALSLATWDNGDFPSRAHLFEAFQYRPERCL